MPEPPVVLVTGTRTGIGRALVEHFAGKGALVEGCSRKPPDWSLENYTHHAVDVADEASVRAMLSSILRRHGHLEVAINNAGVASMNHLLLTPASTFDRVFATNVRGAFLVCRESAKLMKRNGYGRIVNIGTVAVPFRLEGEAVYAASKNALVSLTQVLAHELAEFGITCNLVGPTPIATDLIHAVPAEKIQRIINRLAIRRLGTFADVINVVDFFVRPESGYVTGQTVYLGGA